MNELNWVYSSVKWVQDKLLVQQKQLKFENTRSLHALDTALDTGYADTCRYHWVPDKLCLEMPADAADSGDDAVPSVFKECKALPPELLAALPMRNCCTLTLILSSHCLATRG